jgi:acetyl-CoA carboxylase biotin carboxyl carrier protein
MPRKGTAQGAGRKVHATSATRTIGKGSQRRATATIAPDTNQSQLDLEFIRGLIEAIDQSSIDSVEIARSGMKIRISKSPPLAPVIAGNGGVSAPAPSVAAPAVAVAEAPPVAIAPKSNLVEVKSPMVGTFYRAPSPEAPSYVELGTTVRKGQTLCILEAMKLMNELESEVDGVVREILADNADPVEYGQVLFRVEPA